ncbi:hypothetical protein CHGG_10483 [Chaetomium globosum CBS 148.51]|uniref:Glycosyl transferase CAP10 domain-containing protein n=1 Tax=Chaetomium globosum (strain ATCC 6205 / CBS 148.51 / DSM 1962 / NBRC 6347 / NRRL 1970) TaxID=306901 RepID=Q2GNH1_CHAGB|nr:uncharacterized protein CHGG_10483 [Chaetomium globosum CBS 148.51]EAQ84079.1 hypothetical protein CHGG_10483 [Chaetomium globosum CBS 148.51]
MSTPPPPPPPRRWLPPWIEHLTTTIPVPKPLNLTTTLTALLAAVLATAICHRQVGIQGQAAECLSEVVCWGVLGAVGAGVRRWGGGLGLGSRVGGEGEGWELVGGGDGPEGEGEGGGRRGRGSEGRGLGAGRVASGWSLGVVALALGVVSACAAEMGALVLFPALTPLLLLAERRLRPGAQELEPGLAALVNSVWGAALVALVAVLAVVRGASLELLLQIIPLAALLVVYVALIPRTDGPRLLPCIPDLESAVPALATRVVVVLAGVLGIQACHTSWCTVTAIGTFGLVASRDLWIQRSELEAVSPVVASLLVLAQIIFMLPKQSKGRWALWALLLLSLVPYLASIVAIQQANLSALHSAEHPIEVLVRAAKVDFEQMLARQSKTYAAAVDEYKRRYGVEPPPGFKEWYQYAVDNQSPIIDEFDMIYESVSPFWRVSGKEVVQIMHDAHKTPDIDLWLCSFSGATAETRCEHPTRSSDRHTTDMFNKLLGDLKGVLPDAKFLVNHLDEPRVVMAPGASNKIPFSVTDLSEKPTWDEITKFCTTPPQKPRDSPLEALGLPFVINRTATLDLCKHPEYAYTHGLFQAPPSFKLIEGLVPVLSTGAPSTMSDILIPSPAYIVEPEFLYDPAADLPWESKSNQLYWTGSTTGAVASSTHDWRGFHRQRFLSLTQNLPPTNNQQHHQQHAYLHQTPTHQLTTSKSTFLNPRHYLTAPTRLFQCLTPLPCRQQRSHFRTLPWQPRDAALAHKLAFDLDGNGISGRYLKLLASRTAVLKQTVLREWHDERLRAWVHYVPVSEGMGEVAEVVGWFLGTERGGDVARGIGEAGREWVG